jgi:hypothetical protein
MERVSKGAGLPRLATFAAPFDTAFTTPFDYAQDAVSAYSGCFMITLWMVTEKALSGRVGQ